MSPKVSQKSKQIRNVIVSLLLILISIFILGILTRSPSTIETVQEPLLNNNAILELYCSEMNQTLLEIRGLLVELRGIEIEKLEELKKQNEKPLSGPTLYASYADEITTSVYPEIPSEYVKAIIWHESRFEPEIMNTKTKATGLMQILPKWHTKRAKNLGVTSLTDPYGNILVGCDILNELTQKYDFNYALNFFAGGYPYADRYKNSASPFVQELNEIIHQMESGEIILGGE